MHHFTIRDMEHLTGIKAHTIRIWEHRYQLVAPKRKDSQHRMYDGNDLKFLLRIALLYRKGHKISRIAAMTAREIDEQILKVTNISDDESLINQLMEASIDLDLLQFNQTLDHLYAAVGLENAMRRVVYPYFEKIGLLWMTGNVIPAQEHFASNLVRNWVLKHMPPDPGTTGKQRQRTLLMCPPNEHHEIPVLFLQYLLRMNGKPAINFGINTSVAVLRAYLLKQEADVILVYMITNFIQSGMEDYVQQLLDLAPNMDIIVAGPAFTELTIHAENLKVMRSLDELIRFAKS